MGFIAIVTGSSTITLRRREEMIDSSVRLMKSCVLAHHKQTCMRKALRVCFNEYRHGDEGQCDRAFEASDES